MERAALAGGLIGQACSDCRRAVRSSVQRLQTRWSVKPSAIAGGLVSGAFSPSRWTGQSSVQRLQAYWSAKHAVIAGWLISGACIVCGRGGGGGLVGQACSACRRACQWSMHRLRAD